MSSVTAKDGTRIYYKDWGTGQPIVFSHGWPLNADSWDEQLVHFASKGYRAIAHDRRGHGRSGQSWNGNEMDTYADDLSTVIEKLGLKDAVLVGHSTGGGEVTRYLGRHGTKRVKKVVLVGAVPPLMLQTKDNPKGLPLSAFDAIREGVTNNRSQFYKDLATPFFGANRAGAQVPEGVLNQFWLWSMQVGLKGAIDCIKAFSETDFTDDLKRIDVPVLVIHGEDDQVVPYADSAPLTVKLVKNGTLKNYPGLPHGCMTTHPELINRDILDFVRGDARPSAEEEKVEVHLEEPTEA